VPLLRHSVQTQQRQVRASEALKALAVAERQRVKMKEETVQNLRARGKEAEAPLALARIQLAATTITSRIDGVVSQTIADPGERMQPGQPIVVINDPQDVWIEANSEETSMRKVQLGSRWRLASMPPPAGLCRARCRSSAPQRAQSVP